MIDFDNIKGIIFDCDGTILDSMYMWRNIFGLFLKSKGENISDEKLNEVSKWSFTKVAGYYIENFDPDETPDNIRKSVNKLIKDFYFNDVKSKEYVKEFLELMKKRHIKMCIATATDKFLIHEGLRINQLDNYFSDIICCSEVGMGKESPLIYEKALKLLNTDKSNTLIFEDALYAVATAKKAGFKVVGIEDGEEFDNKDKIKNLCDMYIENYKDLIEYIS